MGLPVGPPVGGTPVLPVPGQPAPMRAGEFTAGSIPQLTTFTLDKIAPPSALYIGRDDQLFLQGMSAQPNETITYTLRLMVAVRSDAVGGQPDSPSSSVPGRPPLTAIEFGQTPLLLPTQNTQATQLVPLSEGFLLSLSALASVTITRGDTFARAMLLRGGSTVAFASQLLFADYVTRTQPSGWPGGRILTDIEGPGVITTFNVSNPAVGADWAVQPTTNQRWRIISWQAQLVTSATVATRVPLCQVKYSPSVLLTTPNQTVPASTTAQVSAVSGGVGTTVAGVVDVNIPLPAPLLLDGVAGNNLGTLTRNIQAGDQWSNINLFIERWELF